MQYLQRVPRLVADHSLECHHKRQDEQDSAGQRNMQFFLPSYLDTMTPSHNQFTATGLGSVICDVESEVLQSPSIMESFNIHFSAVRDHLTCDSILILQERFRPDFKMATISKRRLAVAMSM